MCEVEGGAGFRMCWFVLWTGYCVCMCVRRVGGIVYISMYMFEVAWGLGVRWSRVLFVCVFYGKGVV